MTLALALAQRNRGSVEPNPVVGAVLVKNGRVIGRGSHRIYGQAHAEVNAVRNAGGPAKTRGATLYVTLEPCCHHGKQPPCTDALIAAGVRRVVCAMADPFELVAGKGIKKLRRAGIKVDVGCLEGQARMVNAPFIKRVLTGKPYVIAKWAQSLDGAIATAAGESKWISSEASRAIVQKIRGRVDAILVGIQTALADDPFLLPRVDDYRDYKRIATRIVLDSQCRLPLNCRLLKTIQFAPVMVAHAKKLSPAAEKRRKALADHGVMTIGIKVDRTGRPNISELLAYLGSREYANILVEGGGEVLAAFFAADEIDEAHIFIAPKLIPGASARRPIGGAPLAKLALAPQLQIAEISVIGGDMYVFAYSTSGNNPS